MIILELPKILLELHNIMTVFLKFSYYFMMCILVMMFPQEEKYMDFIKTFFGVAKHFTSITTYFVGVSKLFYEESYVHDEYI